MRRAHALIGQGVLYALFFVPLVLLTTTPVFQAQAPEMATLKLAVRHAGAIVGECETLSDEAYEKLPANMKRIEICPRERSPLRIELVLDGKTLYRNQIPASGFHNDGLASMYSRFTVPAGTHHLVLKMSDDGDETGFSWTLEQNIELQPRQVMVATFKEGFILL